MSSRCSSAPRMKQVFTPRVKDGRRSNQSPVVHYYNKSAPRFSNANPHYHYNPENSPAKRKLYPKQVEQEVQQFVDQKINLDQNPTFKAQPQQPPPAPKNQQKTIQGRKLEFPAEQRPQGGNYYSERPQTVELKRSSASTGSLHFVDRSVKSSAVKQKKREFDEKFKVAFGYLLDQNEAYLKEVRRACNQKARPKDEIFKVKRPTITTTAQDQFHQKDTPYAQQMHPVAETVANSFGPRKVCGNSTSNEFHAGKTGPRADLAQWPDHYKLQGPLYSVTNHMNHYPDHGKFDKMVPIATFNEHPLGMPHRTNSTSRTFHKGEWTNRADLATWKNMHPYGNEFDPNRGTTYGNLHNQKDVQPIQQWPMYQPQLIKSDGKFDTEYITKLQDPTAHELNEQNYCSCERKKKRH